MTFYFLAANNFHSYQIMRLLKKDIRYLFNMGKPSRKIFCGINHSKMMVILSLRILCCVGSNYKATENATFLRLVHPSKSDMISDIIPYRPFFCVKTLFCGDDLRIWNSRLIFHLGTLLSSWNSFKMEECKMPSATLTRSNKPLKAFWGTTKTFRRASTW